MTHNSVQPRDGMDLNVYRFLPFAKNIVKNIGKNVSKTLSSQYSQNFLIMLKNLPQMLLKLLQKSNSKNSGSNW